MIREMPEEEPIPLGDTARQREISGRNPALRGPQAAGAADQDPPRPQQARREQQEKALRPGRADMKEAEKLLYEEFAYALNIRRDQVLPFILQELGER